MSQSNDTRYPATRDARGMASVTAAKVRFSGKAGRVSMCECSDGADDMKWTNTAWVILGLMLAVCCASTAAEDRPGWAQRYLENPPESWIEWRNSLAPKGEAAGPLTLATAGKTDYVIVVPEKASIAETRAASELQLWLGEITGAEFPIVSDGETRQTRELSVGRTARLDRLGNATMSAAGLAGLDKLPREGYTIAADGERLFLLGGEQSGPLSAVFALLEEDLGVRWYEPAIRQGSWDQLSNALNAKRWEMGVARIPRQTTLEARIVPRTAVPAFPVRHLSWQRSYNPWALRNRVNGGYAHPYGQHGYVDGSLFVHTFHRLVPPKTFGAEHPDYYSLIGGTRTWKNAQLCLSNPQVAGAAATTAAEILSRIPESQHASRHLVGVSAMDWLGDCECDECRKVMDATGGYSGLLLTFVNRVAERLATDYPWATVTTLAYRQSKKPPVADIEAHPNVAVRFCTDFGASFTWPYHSLYDTQIADLAEQHAWFSRWQTLSPRMHLWIYPHQYRHPLAPMPSIRAVADNLRFFHERQAESVYVQQSIGCDRGREPMRYWIFAKLMWNPGLDVEDLVRDFVWGTYGAAAPDVFAYEQLLLDHCTMYTDFSRPRNWIYAIHNEAMYRHDFVAKARAILARAEAAADSDDVRRRVELLKAGVVYVETVQLYAHMRDGTTPPDVARYTAVAEELNQLCDRLDIGHVGFFDGTRTIAGAADWIAEMRKVHERRFDQRYLPAENWGDWRFRWDPDNEGVEEQWFRADLAAGDGWTPVTVPAFLADTPAGNAIGYGWYRTTFTLPDAHAGKPVELHFGGVDEQAWLYVNGQPAGEHTLESEFMVGQAITVADLWNRPFEITIEPRLLKPGQNVLAVRIHNSAMNAGIHQPVQAYLPDVAYRDACDGAILTETFETVKPGEIPSAWKRYIQTRGTQVFGIAEVSRQFARHATLHLRDQRSHAAVWSVSDDILPEDGQWTVQFDFRLTDGLVYKGTDAGQYKAANAGAIFGLKRGERGSPEFLPLVQFDNDETAGAPVTLLGFGEVLATDIIPDKWHRLVIRRDGTTWSFYLDDEQAKTIAGRDTDLRGFAFGSFRNWPHVAQDIHYANLKIGHFVDVDAANPGP